MASFVIKAMEHDGTKILMGRVATEIFKDNPSGKLKVTIKSDKGVEHEEFDTVLLAAGMLYIEEYSFDKKICFLI